MFLLNCAFFLKVAEKSIMFGYFPGKPSFAISWSSACFPLSALWRMHPGLGDRGVLKVCTRSGHPFDAGSPSSPFFRSKFYCNLPPAQACYEAKSRKKWCDFLPGQNLRLVFFLGVFFPPPSPRGFEEYLSLARFLLLE